MKIPRRIFKLDSGGNAYPAAKIRFDEVIFYPIINI